MQTVNYLIIGAGPTGLAFAYRFRKEALILEKESKIGGLCRSFTYHGGVFDLGGHSFHTWNSKIQDLIQNILGVELFYQKRDAGVFIANTLIPYPFQQFYTSIPDPSIVTECAQGLEERSDETRSLNFEEYILAKFGPGIARHFMLPYNRKLWTCDLKTMTKEWTSERVAGLNQGTTSVDGKRKPLESNTLVGYPCSGGYEEIIKAFSRFIPNIELNCKVETIDLIQKIVTTRDGCQFSYKKLITTMPLPDLLKRISHVPLHLLTLAEKLEHNSLHLELFTLKRPLKKFPHRIYIPDPNLPPNKVVFNHYSSPELENLPVHSVSAEVAYSKWKPIDHSSVSGKIVEWLFSIDAIQSETDILWNGQILIDHAYPVPTIGKDAIVREIKEYLQKNDIYSVGRFGEWDYLNTDECIQRGFDLAENLVRS